MKGIKTFQGTIYPWNCDHMGHMNVQFYVEKFDQATWNLCSHFGLTSKYLRENKRGMAAVDQHIKYLKEIVAGENIYIESEILEVKEKTVRFRHTMYNIESNEICAETEITGLHIDAEQRKAIYFPEFAKQKFQEFKSKNDKFCSDDRNIGKTKHRT